MPNKEDDGLHPWRPLGRRLADLRKAAGYTQERLAPEVQLGRSSIANIETGHQQTDRTFWLRCDEVLSTGGILTGQYDEITAALQRTRRLTAQRRVAHVMLSGLPPTAAQNAGIGGRGGPAEAIRARVEGALGDTDVSPASLDEWEDIVTQHARATRSRPAGLLLVDLLTDIDDLQQLLGRRHTASGLMHTTRLTAQMAGLLSFTFLKINEFGAARQWGRTARIAAADCRDPAISSWVWAQEAHRHFYAGDPVAAINAARRAQHPDRTVGGVGHVLAAALEGRARAAIGDGDGTRSALLRAEDLLAGLRPGDMEESALGYDEAQLRFHAGNAFTHLGDTGSARTAQERALELYPKANYLDRALIHLDHAACLIHDGDSQTGARHLVHTLSALPAEQLDRLLITRAETVIDQTPPGGTNTPAYLEARDFLATAYHHNPELPQ